MTIFRSSFLTLSFLVVIAQISVAQATDLGVCKSRLARTGKVADKDKTVVDFLLEIPDDLLGWNSGATGKPWTLENRVTHFKVCDEENGYLEIDPGQDFDADYKPAVALFRRKNKSPFLALSFENSHAVFLAKEQGKWKNITDEVFPKLTDEFVNKKINEGLMLARKDSAKKLTTHYTDNASEDAVVLQLPRKGTTISASCNVESLKIYKHEIFKIRFNGERFTIAE